MSGFMFLNNDIIDNCIWGVLSWASYYSRWWVTLYHISIVRVFSLIAFSGLISWSWLETCFDSIGQNILKVQLYFMECNLISRGKILASFAILSSVQGDTQVQKYLYMMTTLCHFLYVYFRFIFAMFQRTLSAQAVVVWELKKCEVQALRDMWCVDTVHTKSNLARCQRLQGVTIKRKYHPVTNSTTFAWSYFKAVKVV